MCEATLMCLVGLVLYWFDVPSRGLECCLLLPSVVCVLVGASMRVSLEHAKSGLRPHGLSRSMVACRACTACCGSTFLKAQALLDPAL